MQQKSIGITKFLKIRGIYTSGVMKKYVSISMIRETLNDIPVYHVPDGFSLRCYRPGDEKLWVKIHEQADQYNNITSETFDRVFNSDFEALAERQYYLLDSQKQAVGTATAWFDNGNKERYNGRVHWVAIIPEMQGKGLAKPLLSAVCEKLRELGHERAHLTTQPERIAAINLYLQFGFMPEVKTIDDLETWSRVEMIMDRNLLP